MRRPDTAGGGWEVSTPASQRLSALVPTRLFHTAWMSTTACISRSSPSPVSPETAIGRHALDLRQPMVGLFPQLGDRARLALDQVPFVHADHQRAPFALDQIGDAKVLLLERPFRVHQQDHHFGKAYGVERVGDRELFELLLDPGAAAHARGVVNTKLPAVPVDFDRNGVAGDAGLGPRQQPLLAEQPVDQRRFSGIGTPDDRDADRPLLGRLLLSAAFAFGVAMFRKHRGRRRIRERHA